MPIQVDADVRPLSEDVFREIAYAVTGAAFAVHNEYGSFFNENVYKHEIADECRRRGLPDVQVEARVRATYGDFVKEYFADLLVGGGALFELKAAAGLADEHRAQTLNYLFLMELHRAKLINLGSPSVQHEFVNTTLTHAHRKRFSVRREGWQALDEDGVRFCELLIELLNDWGSFLQLPLYYEAVTHFFGGEDRVVGEIPVLRAGGEATRQKVHLLNPNTAFKLTALGNHLPAVREHLQRFLHHSRLRAVQWVNIHQHDVQFTTLLNT